MAHTKNYYMKMFAHKKFPICGNDNAEQLKDIITCIFEIIHQTYSYVTSCSNFCFRGFEDDDQHSFLCV